MSIRVHELAKRCGVSNKDMIDKLHSINYPVKTHSSTVDKITAESILKDYGYVAPVPEPVTPKLPEPAATASEPTTQIAAATATLEAPPQPPAPKQQQVAPPAPA